MPKISSKKTKDYSFETLDNYIDKFIKYLEKSHFSKSVIKKYESTLGNFQTFCIQNQISNFLSHDILEQFLVSLLDCSQFTIKFKKGILNKFKDFVLTGSFKKYYRNPIKCLVSISLSDTFSSYIDFLKYTDLKASTKHIKQNIIFNFLTYLENNNIYTLSILSQKDVINYINSPKFAHSTKCTISKELKLFFNFTFNSKTTLFSGNELFPTIKRNYNARILSFYSIEEVKTLISTIDTTSSNGKRNYAIILLAAILGLRASDIVNLKINNIDWNKKLITIVQQKTQKTLIQPFPDEVLYSLLDYIKNARPKTDVLNIFVSCRPPFKALHPSALSCMVDSYFKLTDIDISKRKHGIHSLRHSLANNMLHNNISLQDISATLGHSYISATTMYTNIDITTLKKLSLEVL